VNPRPLSSGSSTTAVRPRLGRRASAAVVVLLALATTLLGIALAAAVGIATAAPASAHDHLVSSDPGDDAALHEPPAAIKLVYSADVLATGARVAVTGPDGDVETGEPQVAGETVVATLPDGLAGGEYTVTWRVVSSDGHPIEGSFGFDVAEQAAPSPSPTESGAPSEPAATPTPEPSSTGEAVMFEPTTGPTPREAEGGARSPWLLGAALLAVAAVGTAAVVRGRRGLGSGHGPAGQD
jgi:methionine-rich copper-binding protein CopC